MIKFKASHPSNYEEFKQGIDLSIKVFGSTATHRLINYLNADEKNLKKNIIIIKNSRNQIIAFTTLIYKKINLYELNSRTAFLCLVCVDEKYRKKGLSKILLNKAFEVAKDNSCDSILLIARKKVDYFYNKFNFWGVSQLSKIIIDKKNFDTPSFNFKLSSSIINKIDVISISRIYTKEYSKLLGYFQRDNNSWNYIIYKCKAEKIKLIKYKFKKKIIGYVAYKDSEIYEISAIAEQYYLYIVNDMLNKIKKNDLIFLFNKNHNIYNFLIDTESTYVTKNINFGAHMIKIINEVKFRNYFLTNSNNKKLSEKMTLKELTLSLFSNKIITLNSKNQMLLQDFYINYLDQH